MTVRLCCTLMFIVALVCSASAQMGMGGGGGGDGAYALDDDEKNLKFAGIPVPGYSDVLGFNLGVVAMVYYKMDRYDDDLPPSTTGVFGFYSENNTWMGGLFQKFHLDQDKWRITAALGTGSFKYQFNPASIGPGFPDVFVDYSTATNFLFGQGSRRAWGKLYLGLGAMSWSAKVKVEPDLIETEDERYTGPGAVAEWDHRDHIMNPRKGFFVEGRYLFFRESLGSARDFEKLNWSASGFTSLGDTTRVLAGRILQEAGFGDVPFSAQSIVNGNRNLRGYANGRYRADQLLALETEYRWNFHGRWGTVVFAGMGWSTDKISEMALNDTLPSAGLGVRFMIIETYGINARIDYGWGKHDQAIYFAIGEAY